MPEVGACVTLRAAEFEDQDGWTERALINSFDVAIVITILFIMYVMIVITVLRSESTDIGIEITKAPWPTTGEEEEGNPTSSVLEVVGGGIERRGVDSRAEVHRRLPTEVVLGVSAPGNPDIEVAETSRPVA
jgi:hypothetical protein